MRRADESRRTLLKTREYGRFEQRTSGLKKKMLPEKSNALTGREKRHSKEARLLSWM